MIALFEPLAASQKSISALAPLEVSSAVRRRESKGDVSTEAAEAIIASLAAEQQELAEQPVTASVLREANAIINRHRLRAIDAIQLASARIVQQQNPESLLHFISADDRLLRAARAEGLATWNPAALQNP